MTASVADHDLSTAILNSIREGTFPDSEDVLTAELPATALPSILGEVSDARQQLEVQQYVQKLSTTLRLTARAFLGRDLSYKSRDGNRRRSLDCASKTTP